MQAMSKKNGQFYAVKMIQSNKIRGHHSPNSPGLDSPSESAKWAREISIMQGLNHENICQLKEVFFEPCNISEYHDQLPRTFRKSLSKRPSLSKDLVLEYVNGGDLLDYIIKRNGLRT